MRQPSEYRNDLSHRLRWLSRRWIYNIPRSLQTQNLRPLGRVALVDHMDRVLEHVAQAIRAAVAPEALAASAEKTGLPFCQGSPRIFIVASITGGTGSGMVIDVGYVVRKILRDLNLPENDLCGLLAYCGGHNPQSRELCVASAYALLTELSHYSDPQHAYPGDPACGLPAFPPQDAPFSQTYVAHLGEDLEPEDFDAAAARLAEYLYYNSVTPAAAFFDACRNPQRDGGPTTTAAPMVRTFGLCQAGLSADDIPGTAADDLCRALLARWRGSEQDEPESPPRLLSNPVQFLAGRFAPALSKEDLRGEAQFRAEAIGLSARQIADEFQAAATDELGSDPGSYLVTVLGEFCNKAETGKDLPGGQPLNRVVLDTLDAMVQEEGPPAAHRACLRSAMEAYVKKQAAKKEAALFDWLRGLMILPQYRVLGAQRGCDYVAQHLRSLSHEASELLAAKLPALHALRESLLADKHQGRRWLRQRGFASGRKLVADLRLTQYFSWRIEELALGSVSRLASLILAQVVLLGDRLRNLVADLNRLSENIGQTPDPLVAAPRPRSSAVARLVAQTVDEHKAAMLAAMERALEDDFRRIVITETNNQGNMLASLLRRMARSLVLAIVKKTALRELDAACHGQPRQAFFSLKDALEGALPRLAHCGGARRLLLSAPPALPEKLLVAQLRDPGQTGPLPTVVADMDNDVCLCYEVEQLPLRQVAAALLDERFHHVEAAARLHTRIDIRWTPL